MLKEFESIAERGGVLGAITATSPGSYVTTNLSRIDRINIASDDSMSYESRLTGSLTKPRWYGTGVLLPTGEVMVFSGADRDEVVLPGSGSPILDTEIYDPKTETWRVMARQHNPRTYHNTAMLLPDGRVLVGGHSPINTGYAYSLDLSALGLSPNQGRDPSFELYSPPYMYAANRPQITSAPSTTALGRSINIGTSGGNIKDVILVKRTTLTHIIDGDQRTVVLPHTGSGNLTATLPTQKGVLPPGSYMLFVISEDATGKRIPSVSVPIMVEGADDRAIGCGVPAARAALSAADWAELDAAFEANRDPLAGHDPSGEYAVSTMPWRAHHSFSLDCDRKGCDSTWFTAGLMRAAVMAVDAPQVSVMPQTSNMGTPRAKNHRKIFGEMGAAPLNKNRALSIPSDLRTLASTSHWAIR